MGRTLLWIVLAALVGLGVWLMTPRTAPEEPLVGLVDYRSLTGGPDGVAVVDLTPHSEDFGRILQDVPIGVGVLPHHLYYNRDGLKLYTTALGGAHLYRIDVDDDRIASITPIDAGGCVVGEDLYFSRDGSRFHLTCMGSDRVVVFDARTDRRIDEITAPHPNDPFVRYPHGISVNEALDRMVITDTVSADLQDAGSNVTVIEYASGRVLETIPLAKSPDAPGAPVEVLFANGGETAYVTGMLDASVWALRWDADLGSFEPTLVDDGAPRGESWPLEMYVGPDGHLYVSWAVPGVVNVYEMERDGGLTLVRTLPADEGAHHIDFSPDGRTMYVQNNLLNLDGLNAGTLTAVDLQTGELIARSDSFLKQGKMPESLAILGGKGHQH